MLVTLSEYSEARRIDSFTQEFNLVHLPLSPVKKKPSLVLNSAASTAHEVVVFTPDPSNGPFTGLFCSLVRLSGRVEQGVEVRQVFVADHLNFALKIFVTFMNDAKS